MCVGTKNLSNSTIDENNICWDSVYSIMMDGQFDFHIGVIYYVDDDGNILVE